MRTSFHIRFNFIQLQIQKNLNLAQLTIQTIYIRMHQAGKKLHFPFPCTFRNPGLHMNESRVIFILFLSHACTLSLFDQRPECIIQRNLCQQQHCAGFIAVYQCDQATDLAK